MPKTKKRSRKLTDRVPFSGKSSVPTVVLLLVGAFFDFELFNTYSISLKRSETEVMNKLSAVANTLSLLIDGDDHLLHTQKYAQKDDITDWAIDSLGRHYNSILKSA